MFDHERLDVYSLAKKFDALVGGLGPCRGHRELKDQIDRASTSILTCIAEGAGRRSDADKRRYYAMARASATECVAQLDALSNRRLLSDAQLTDGRTLLHRIVQILSKLSAPPPTPRELERERER
jgi:four helix bundle protein